MSDAAEKPGAQFGQWDSNQDIELLLLASAGAIQRIIAERNALRSRAQAQERELRRLRHQVSLIHDSYRRLTTEYMTQFQLIDSAVSNFVRDPTEPEGTRLGEQKFEPHD